MPRPPSTLVLNYLLRQNPELSTQEAMTRSDEIVTLLEEAGHLQSTATRTASGSGLLSSESRGENVQGNISHREVMDSQRPVSERSQDGNRREITMVRPTL
jgi:hypothetical protein